jgi:hypothetical protein
MKLDSRGRRLLAHLVQELPQVVPNNPTTFITYKQVHDRLRLPLSGSTYGESLKAQGLANLADWTAANRYPGVTGIIIDGTSMMPGEGYFRLFRRDSFDFDWWAEQVRLSKEFDWAPHILTVDLPAVPLASDIEAPARATVTTSRIIRDTVISMRVKALHKYRCQICGHTISLSDGSKYAEAHHIRPVGSPHSGPDVAENVLCLCPNHHAELDYGARSLALDELRLVRGHSPSAIYITYHNDVICRR